MHVQCSETSDRQTLVRKLRAMSVVTCVVQRAVLLFGNAILGVLITVGFGDCSFMLAQYALAKQIACFSQAHSQGKPLPSLDVALAWIVVV